MTKHFFSIVVWIGSIILISACSHQNNLQTFNGYYYGGQNAKAYKYAKSKAGKNGDVLWNLQASVSAFSLAREDKDLFGLLEQGETLFSKYEAEGLMGGALGNFGAVLVNENIKTYRGNIYEGVMFNYYKALYAMSQNDYARARVEFNRANDRQRRAKDYFRKDIQKALDEQSQQNAKDKTLSQVDVSSSNRSISPILQKEYSNLKNFQAYEGFINPAVSYVSALFFMTEGDFAKATDLYKESYGINAAQVITQDLQVLQNRKNGKNTTYTWLIIEDGKSAFKNDTSINISSFYVSNDVLHIGISIPTLQAGKMAARNYSTQNESGETFKAYEISDLDSVIASEFQKQLPFILTRAISSAILKASTQAILGDKLGTAGALAGMLYSMGTTSADVRISTALPKRVLALQIPNNSGHFVFKADENPLYNVYFDCQKSEQFLQEKRKNRAKVIVLCQNYDNILYFRIKDNNPTYRILKGGESE